MTYADEVLSRIATGQEMAEAGQEMELVAAPASTNDMLTAKGEDMELLHEDAAVADQKSVSIAKYFVPAKDLSDPLPTKKQMKKFMKGPDKAAKKALKIMRRRRSYGDARDQWVDAQGHLHMGPGRRRVGSGMAHTKWVPPAYNAPPPGPSPYAAGSGLNKALGLGSAAGAVLTQLSDAAKPRKFKKWNSMQGAVFKEAQEVDDIVSGEPVPQDEFVESEGSVDDVVEEDLLSTPF
jgi:hypothetical protein